MSFSQVMLKGDLDKRLLHILMIKLGELRETGTQIPEYMVATASYSEWCKIQRHIDFLEAIGFVKIHKWEHPYRCRAIELTSKGHLYVQPELAEFEEPSVLQGIVTKFEEMATLSYPEGERESILFELRKAVAEKAPDLVAKIVVAIAVSKSEKAICG